MTVPLDPVSYAVGLVTRGLAGDPEPSQSLRAAGVGGGDITTENVQSLLATFAVLAMEIAREGAARAGCSPEEILQPAAARLQRTRRSE